MHIPAHAAHAQPFWPAAAGMQENIVTLLGVPIHSTDWQIVEAMRRFGEISADGIIRCGLSPQHAPDGAQTVTCLIRFADCYGIAYGASAAAAAAAREVLIMGQVVQVHLGRLAAEPMPIIHQQLSRMAQLLGAPNMGGMPMEEKAQGGMAPSQWHPHHGPFPNPQLTPGRATSDDWQCTSCGNVNFAYRARCNRCRKPSGLSDHQNVLQSSICPVTVMLQSVPQGTTNMHCLEALSPFGELVLAMPSMTPAKLAKHLAKHTKGGIGPLHFFCRFALEASARAAVKHGEVTILGHQVSIRHAYSRQRGGPAAACYHPGAPGQFMLAPSAIGGQYHTQCAGHSQYASACPHPGYCPAPHSVPMLKQSQSMQSVSSDQMLVNDPVGCMWGHEVMGAQVVGGVHVQIEPGANSFNPQQPGVPAAAAARPAAAYSQRTGACTEQQFGSAGKSACMARVVDDDARRGGGAAPTTPAATATSADGPPTASHNASPSAGEVGASPTPPPPLSPPGRGQSAKKASSAGVRAAAAAVSPKVDLDPKAAAHGDAVQTLGKPAANGKPPPNPAQPTSKMVPAVAREEAAAAEARSLGGANSRAVNVNDEGDLSGERLVYAVRRLHLQPQLDAAGKE